MTSTVRTTRRNRAFPSSPTSRPLQRSVRPIFIRAGEAGRFRAGDVVDLKHDAFGQGFMREIMVTRQSSRRWGYQGARERSHSSERYHRCDGRRITHPARWLQVRQGEFITVTVSYRLQRPRTPDHTVGRAILTIRLCGRGKRRSIPATRCPHSCHGVKPWRRARARGCSGRFAQCKSDESARQDYIKDVWPDPAVDAKDASFDTLRKQCAGVLHGQAEHGLYSTTSAARPTGSRTARIPSTIE